MIKAIIRADSDNIFAANSDYMLVSSSILLLVDDGSARLLDLGGTFFAMNPTGAAMLFETLRAGFATAARRVAAEYHSELEQVRIDLRAFLGHLERNRLIYRAGADPGARRRAGLLARHAIRPHLYCIDHWIQSVPGKARALLALAYLSIRLFGWPRTVEAWQDYHQRNLARSLLPTVKHVTTVVDDAVRSMAACHLFNVECKERALSCWSLLRSAGLSPKLVVGVDLYPFASHCWCQLDEMVLSDYEDRCNNYAPVWTYE
jgi:hypothetical protein